MNKHYVWQMLSIEVMNTTLSSGSWGVDEELLIKDSWSEERSDVSNVITNISDE